MTEIKTKLAAFFTNHEARRDEKRKMDNDYEKEQRRMRSEFQVEDEEWRRKQDLKQLEALEQQHKNDLEWHDKMRQYYEHQQQQWIQESDLAMKELKMIRQRVAQGQKRHSSLLREKQLHHHDLNEQTDAKIKQIHDLHDYLDHPDPKVF